MTAAPRKSLRPLLLPGLILALVLAFSVWSLDQARRRTSPVINEDYYDYGLKYTGTDLERRSAGEPDWSLTVRLDGCRLEARLTDELGRAVAGGTGELFLMGTAIADPETPLVLVDRGKGYYQARLPDDLEGQVAARLVMKQSGLGLRRSLLLNL